MNLALLKTELIHDEVMYLDPFNNARGNRAVGVSRDLDINPLTPEEEAVVGHDGRSKSISRGAAAYLLNADITRTLADLDRVLPWWRVFDEVRRRALINLAFSMGAQKLLGFREMLGWMRQGNYEGAATCLLNTAWAKQHIDRARRLSVMLRIGIVPVGEDA